MDLITPRIRVFSLLLCSIFFSPVILAQTTVTYSDNETNSTAYDTTANPLTLSVPTGSATQSGVISGNDNVTKTGAGTLSLSGASTYTGDTIVDGGIIDITGSLSNTSKIYPGLTSDGTFQISAGGQVTTSSYVELGHGSGVTGTLTVSGAGATLTDGYYLDVGFDGSGELNITNGGGLSTTSFARLGVNATGIGTGVVSGTGSQFNVGGQLELGTYGNGTLTIDGGGTVSAQALHFDRLVTGSGTLNLNTGGVLVITTTGGIVNFGTPSDAAMNFAGGTLQSNSSWTTSVDATLSNTSTIDTSANLTFSGVLSGSGGLNKTGTGTLNLSATNTYSGTTTVSGGLIEFSAANNFGSGNVTLNGGGLIWASSTTTDVSSRLNAIGASGGTLDTNGNDVTLASAVTGTGILTKKGGGTLSLAITDSLGGFAIAGGSLAVTSDGVLELGGGNSLTASNGGTLVLSDGTLRLGGTNFSMFVPTTLDGDATFDSNGNTGGIYGPLSGSGGFRKTGAGVLTVTNANTFSGSVLVEQGTLVVNTAPDLGTGNGNVTVNGGAFLAAATNLEFARVVAVTGTDSVIVSPNHLEVGSAGDGSLTLGGGAILGSGTTTTLAYYGSDTGTINASGTNSILYANGALRIGYGGNGTLSLENGATANAQNLILASQSGSMGTINLNSGGVLRVGGTDGITIGGGTGAFNLAGGTLQVGGDARVVAIPPSASFNLTNLANDIRAIINANTPQGGDSGLTTAIPMTLSNTSTVDTNGSAATLSGVLSGTGSLIKAGTGTLTLAGANTFSGTTTVSVGTLALGINGSLANSSSIDLGTAGTLDLTAKNAFSFGAGQSLSGTGTVNLGAGKTITFSGSLSAGNSAGVVNVTGDLVFDGSSTIAMELAGAGGVAGTDFDQINVSGNLTLGGTLNVTLANAYTPSGGDTFQVFQAAGFSGAFAAVNLPTIPVGLKWNTANLTSTGSISIVANIAPTIGGSPATTVNEDTPYSFTPTASDADNDTLTFSIANKPAWAAFDTNTGALTGTPGNSDVGTYSNIGISVSDGIVSTALAAFTLTVGGVNDAPTLTAFGSAVAGTQEDAAVDITFATLIAQGDEADIDGTIAAFVVKSVSSGSLTINGSAWAAASNDRITAIKSANWTPPANDSGTFNVFAVVALDDQGAESSGNVTAQVTVSTVNDSPSLAVNNGLTLDQGTAAIITSAALAGQDVDDTPAGLTYTVTAATVNGRLELSTNAGVAITSFTQDDIGNGLVRYVHNGSATASDSFSFSLADGGEDGALPVAGIFSITVTLAPTPEPDPDPGIAPIDSTIINGGTFNNPVIGSSGTVEGGTLTGGIQNSGTIKDVILGPGATVVGGEVGGTISGNTGSPAYIDNAHITEGAHLENVVIGAGTTLAPGVTLGENVRFDSADSIPPGIDLSGALDQLDWADGDQRKLVDLGDDVLTPDSNGEPTSLIRSIQLLGEFESAGNTAEQAVNGEILVVSRDFSAVILPVRVSMAEADEKEGTFINDDGDIVFVTASRRIVLSYPALQDKPGTEAILENLGLSLSYDERANLILTPAGGDALRTNHPVIRALSIAEDSTAYLSARPDVLALPADQGKTPGMYSVPFPGLSNVTVLSIVFEDDNGNLLQQLLVPVPADWLILKESLAALPGMSDVRINSRGVISGFFNESRFRALSRYRVERDAQDLAVTGHVVFQRAGDTNGDGHGDFWIIYPNGDRQLLLIFP